MALTALLLTALLDPALGGDTLRYAEDRAPAIVNPLFGTTMSEARLNELLFDGLFTDDQELRSAPRLAESFEVAEDRMSMIVHLRHGVTWHDGHAFSAGDVVFTIRAMRARITASTEASRVAWIDSVSEIDDHTVKITFEEPEFAPQDKLHFKILPEHSFQSISVSRNDPFRTRPVGTGPYVLAAFNDDNSISLRRHGASYDPARITDVVMREVSDKNYQAKLLTYESLEALVRVLPRDLAALQADRKVELYPYQTNSWWYVGFNQSHSALSEREVREAIAMTIDVEDLLRPIGTGDLLTGPFVKSSPYYNHDVAPVPYDPERGAGLLQAAGYTLSNRTWIGPDGEPLKLRLATQSNLETAQDVVINLQSQLQNRGIAVEPEFLGVAEWKQRVWRERDFDLILSQWSFDRNEDIHQQFHSKGSRNFVGYGNPEVDRVLDEAQQALDPQEKKAKLRQAHALIAADMPMVFLWTLDSYSAMSLKVRNVVVHPFYFFTWATDWTLSPG